MLAGKVVQRRLYDALQLPLSKCYVLLLLFAFVAGFIFHMNWPLGSYCLHCRRSKYIGETHGVDISGMVAFEPVDYVFTWVNGSDPLFTGTLAQYKSAFAQTEEGSVDNLIANQTCDLSHCYRHGAAGVECLDPLSNCGHIDASVYLVSSCRTGDDIEELLYDADAWPFWIFSRLYDSNVRCKTPTDPGRVAHKPACMTSQAGSHSILHPFALYLYSASGPPATLRNMQDLKQAIPESLLDGIVDVGFDEVNGNFALLLFSTPAKKNSTAAAIHELATAESRVRAVLRNSVFPVIDAYPAYVTFCWNSKGKIDGDGKQIEEAAGNRYADNDELRYSLRSLDMFAPWVHHVWIVTNGQIPSWLDLNNPHVTVVSHQEIFEHPDTLPTFSSPAIESQLHRIPGLSKRFIYSNDDMFIGRKLYPDDIETHTFGQKVLLSYALPNCAVGCPHTWIHDGYCDRMCNNTDCDFDGGDCTGSAANSPIAGAPPSDAAAAALAEGLDLALERAYCSSGCSNAWIADGFCDQLCNVMACGFDAGDCGLADIFSVFPMFRLDSNRAFTVPSNTFVAVVNTNNSSEVPSFRSGTCSVNETIFVNHSAPFLRTASYLVKESLLIVIAHRQHSAPFNATCSVVRADNVAIDVSLTFTDTRPSADQEKPSNCVPSDAGVEWLRFPNVTNVPSESPRNFRCKFPLRMSRRISQLCQRYLAGEITLLGLKHYADQTKTASSGPMITFDLFARCVEVVGRRNLLRKIFPASSLSTTTPTVSTTTDPVPNVVQRPRLGRRQREETTGGRISGVLGAGSPTSTASPQEQPSYLSSAKPDAYALSLLHVNRLLNRLFGYAQRKIPAHAPILIDRHVMAELASQLGSEWQETAARRFRSPQDVQLQLAYGYYILSATYADEPFSETIQRLFDIIDVDFTAKLSRPELRLLASRVHEDNADDSVDRIMSACGPESPSIEAAKFCPPLRELFERLAAATKRYLAEPISVDDEIAIFRMIRSDPVATSLQLESIRRRPPQYFCLNDDLDHDSPESANGTAIVRHMLADFLSSYFPRPSQFEKKKLSDNNRGHLGANYGIIIAATVLFLICLVVLIVFCRRVFFNRHNPFGIL